MFDNAKQTSLHVPSTSNNSVPMFHSLISRPTVISGQSGVGVIAKWAQVVSAFLKSNMKSEILHD